ncbi:MAG: isoprenylcysteine carboxylmethyltransferase family protein [Chloroflexota bacterium]
MRRIYPPVYLLLGIIVGIGLHFLLPNGRFIPAPFNLLGILLILLGLGMMLWSSNRFSRSDTTIIPFQESSQLVQSGLFRFSRNPIYLGMAIILTGVAVILGSIVPFLMVPLFMWIIQRNFIIHEEVMLEETFGEDYRQYKKEVRRWL